MSLSHIIRTICLVTLALPLSAASLEVFVQNCQGYVVFDPFSRVPGSESHIALRASLTCTGPRMFPSGQEELNF